MAKKNLGTVKTPTGSEYYYYWDTSSGKVTVGSEYAGNAVSEEDAWRKANFYATTNQIMK